MYFVAFLRKIFKGLKFTVLGMIASSIFLSVQVNSETPKNALVIADAIDDLISLDPAELFEFSGLEYSANSYDRLVSFDVNDVSNVFGNVAESWTVSEDNKTFTFKIKEGIKFASGNDLTADDVVFSLQRVIKLNKPPAFILGQFGFTEDNVEQQIRLVDDFSFEMELAEPYAQSFVLYCLTSGVASIVDKDLVMQHEQEGDLGNGWLRTNYAGSGPLVLNSWKPNESLSMKANENYWGDVPSMKSVFIKHVPESSVQRLLLEKGDIDIAKKLGTDQLKGIADNEDIYVITRPKGTIYYLGLNQKNEHLSKPKVIEALKYLIEYQAIEDTIISGSGVIHQAFLPVGFLGALEDKPYSFNIEKAKELLSEAGLPDGFKVSMDTRNTTLILDMAKAIQTTWAKAGIELEIIPGDNKQTLTKYRGRQHDIYIGRWGPDYQDPHTNADGFASNPDNSDDASFKTLAWRNAWDAGDMTERVKQAALEPDANVRKEIYLELQREHQKVSPFVIMFQEVENIAIRKGVDNFIQGPSIDTNFYYGVTKSE